MEDIKQKKAEIDSSSRNTMLLVFSLPLVIIIFWLVINASIVNRDNLPKEYYEVFATPFENVAISDYSGSWAGHGSRFEFTVKAAKPIKLKDEPSFESAKIIKSDIDRPVEITDSDRNKFPWATQSFYREQVIGDLLILFDSSKTMYHVSARVPQSWAVTREGNRLVSSLQLRWPNTLEQEPLSWSTERRVQMDYAVDRLGQTQLVTFRRSVDPKLFEKTTDFEQYLQHQLSELDNYKISNIGKERSAITVRYPTEKVLQLNMPDASLSQEQLSILSNIASELSQRFSAPKDKIPMRLELKIFLNP